MKKERIIEVLKALIIFTLFFTSGYLKGILAQILPIDVKDLSSKDFVILTLLADLIIVFVIFLVYRKDLIKEWKKWRKNLAGSFDTGLKYWLLGLAIMMVSNTMIAMFTPLKNSGNETTVQGLIATDPFLMFLAAGLFAPLIEEITFRKTLKGILKNKWLFAIASFLLFGYIHVSGNLTTPYEALYIIPYGALGFTFALAYYETDTVFTSISMHAIHNCLLILLAIMK